QTLAPPNCRWRALSRNNYGPKQSELLLGAVRCGSAPILAEAARMASTPQSTGPRKPSTDATMDSRASFFQRWSRRKLDCRKRNGKESGRERQPLVEDHPPEVDFDALDFNSDYARFMLPQIPHTLRSKALRKLWASNAAFTQPDGLQDYAMDYTDAATK